MKRFLDPIFILSTNGVSIINKSLFLWTSGILLYFFVGFFVFKFQAQNGKNWAVELLHVWVTKQSILFERGKDSIKMKKAS